jgi:hypothetical protein
MEQKVNPADKVERWKIERLVPYARNARTHSDEQVAQIAASIREWGWTTPVLVDEDGGIIAGHGRTLAAQRLQMIEVPVMVARGWSDAKKRAYVLADNKLAMNAGWDEEILQIELLALKDEGFNIDLIGFDGNELAEIFADDAKTIDENNPYTSKIKTPIYEPQGKKPSLEELYDDKKSMDLIVSIQESKLNEKEKQFLMTAASRHIVFDYGKIANFYAHSSKECQELMENSALVIIDFNKAIENGFVVLTDEISSMFELDEVEEDE